MFIELSDRLELLVAELTIERLEDSRDLGPHSLAFSYRFLEKGGCMQSGIEDNGMRKPLTSRALLCSSVSLVCRSESSSRR